MEDKQGWGVVLRPMCVQWRVECGIACAFPPSLERGGGGTLTCAALWPSRKKQSPITISHLVDPASSHMLSSKAKPCMSKYKGIRPETANGSLQRS